MAVDFKICPGPLHCEGCAGNAELIALRAERDALKAVRDGMIFLLAEAVKKDTTIAQPSDWSNPHLAVHVWGEPGCAECYELTLQTFLNVASDHSKRIVELSHERDALRARVAELERCFKPDIQMDEAGGSIGCCACCAKRRKAVRG